MAKPPELSSTLVNGNLARAVWRPAWSPDGTQFVVADAAGNIVVFEERESRFVVRTTLHDPPRVTEPGEPQCYGVAWPTSDVIVSLDRSADGFCTNQRRASDLSVTAVAKSPECHDIESGGNGAWVVTGRGEAVTVLAVPGLETVASSEIGNRDYIDQGLWALATDPKGTLLAASTDGGREEEFSDKVIHYGDPRVDIIDVASKQTIALIPYLARSLAFDPWRQQLVHVGFPRTYGVKCFSYTGALVRELKMPTQGAVAAAVTKAWIITSSTENGTLLLWDAETLELVATVAAPDEPETEWIVPSPDGTRLLTKAANHAVRIWKLDSGVRAALDAGDHTTVLSMLFDLEYLERRCRTSVAELLADLAYVLRQAPAALPADAIFVHPSEARLGRGAVSILETLLTLQRDRLQTRPERLFQVLHDELYWYDAPARSEHQDGPLASPQTEASLWRWADHARAIFEARVGAAWLRQLRPPRIADAALPAWQQVGEVRDVSPDGARAFVAAGGDLYLIDVMTGNARGKYVGANRGRFSADGSHLLTCTGPTAALWTSDAKTLLHALGPHPAEIQRIMFSRDGQLVFTMSTKELRAWRVADGSCVTHATGSFIEDVLLCGDRAIVFYERGVGWQRWDGATTPTRVADDTGEYLVVAVSKAGDRFVQQCSSTGSLQGWSIPDGTRLFETKTPFMMALAFHPDGSCFVGTDGVLRDATTGTETSRLSTEKSLQPSFDPTGRFLLSSHGIYGNEAALWDVATGSVVARLAITSVSHLNPIWSHDGRVLALPHHGVTAIADLAALSPSLRSRDDAHPVGYYARPRFSPSGATLVVGHEDGMGFWDAERGVIRTFVEGVKDMGSFDAGRCVLGRRGVTLHAYGSEDAAEQWRIDLPEGDFESMTAADAGAVVIVAQSLPSSRIVALAIDDGARRYEIEGEHLVRCEGDVLLTRSTEPGAVKLRAAATGEVSIEIRTTCSTLALSPDHRWLAAADGKIEVWDLKTGTLHRTIESDARCVAFREDSAALIASDWVTQQSGNQDWNTEAVYDLATGACLSDRGWWDYDAEPTPPRELAPGILLEDSHLRVHEAVVELPIDPIVCRTQRGEIVVASTHGRRVELFAVASRLVNR